MGKIEPQRLKDTLVAAPDSRYNLNFTGQNRPGVAYVKVQSDQEITDRMNIVDSVFQIEREDVTAQQLIEAVEVADFEALSPGKQNLWQMIVAEASNPDKPLNLKSPKLRAIFASIWGSTTTATNLVALQTRDGSEAESLFGVDTVLQRIDVNRAREIV